MKRKILSAAMLAAICAFVVAAGSIGCSNGTADPDNGEEQTGGGNGNNNGEDEEGKGDNGDNGDDVGSGENPSDKMSTFRLETSLPDSGNDVFPSDITAYLFDAEDVLARTQVYAAEKGTIEIEAPFGTQACFISGASLNAETGVTKRTDLLKMSYGADVEHHDSAPEIMTAQTTLSNETDRLMFVRRTARIDLDTSADSRIAVSEIVLLNAPASTCPFTAGGDAGGETLEYCKSFATPFSGTLADLFRVYEKSSAVDVIVRGTYGSIPIYIKAAIPSVEAGKVYTLSIMNAGSTFEAVFDISPWQEGDTVAGYPDTEYRIMLDRENSVFSKGVKVDFDTNRVEVPADGAQMTLAFKASTSVEISAVEGGDYIVLGQPSVESAAGVVVTKFDVTVSPQGRGRLGYEAVLHLKYALLSGSYDYVKLCVAPSPSQIETVAMAGSVWMAFNARSRELDDQIYPLDGATVEDMYRTNWIGCVGGLFQFGRMYMYTPWQGYNPANDLGGQKQDIPWHSDTHMPCPEGYRVPTPAELKALLPDGAVLEGGSATYKTPNDETITAAIFTAEGTISTPTGVSGTPRYIKLTSGGKYLIIPLAGGKGDKSTTNNPSFGQQAVLWTNDNTGMPGGWALTHTVEYNSGTPKFAASRLQMEAFASLRCVKE